MLRKDTGGEVVAILVAVCAFLREPRFFLSPRIWAEEGTVHLQSVMDHGPIDSMLLPHLGYLSLFNNAVASIGLSLFGFNGVAFVTTGAAFVVMLLAICAPLILDGPLWETPASRYAVVVYALLISSGEIWLNTINVQFYFCLFASFLLLTDRHSLLGWRRWYASLMVLVGVLNGITTIALLPFFFFRYLMSGHDRFDARLLLIMVLGLSLQVGVLFTNIPTSGMERFSLSFLSTFPAGIFETLRAGVYSLPDSIQWIVEVGVLIVCVVGAWKTPARTVAVVALYLVLLFSFLSVGMAGGQRYGYVSSVLFFLALLCGTRTKGTTLRRTSIVFSLLLFVVGVRQFGDITPYYESHWLAFSEDNVLRQSSGKRLLMVFPQGPGKQWFIEIDDPAWARYGR